MPVSRYQVSNVIAVYLNNIKAHIGISKKAVADSEDMEVKIPIEFIEDLVYDRVGPHLLDKLKKARKHDSLSDRTKKQAE